MRDSYDIIRPTKWTFALLGFFVISCQQGAPLWFVLCLVLAIGYTFKNPS